MLGAQASGAQVKPFWLALYNNSSWMNIRQPAPFGVAFGVSYIMAKLG